MTLLLLPRLFGPDLAPCGEEGAFLLGLSLTEPRI